jgi:hypothetical protein
MEQLSLPPPALATIIFAATYLLGLISWALSAWHRPIGHYKTNPRVIKWGYDSNAGWHVIASGQSWDDYYNAPKNSKK